MIKIMIKLLDKKKQYKNKKKKKKLQGTTFCPKENLSNLNLGLKKTMQKLKKRPLKKQEQRQLWKTKINLRRQEVLKVQCQWLEKILKLSQKISEIMMKTVI